MSFLYVYYFCKIVFPAKQLLHRLHIDVKIRFSIVYDTDNFTVQITNTRTESGPFLKETLRPD